MSWSILLLSAAGAAALLVLALRLRGPRRGDPTAPPKPKPRHLPHEELDELTALVGRGGEEEARRRLKSAGYSDAQVRRLIWLMTKVAEADSEAGGA